MTILDRLLAAVTPTEDSEKNREARVKMQAAAGATGWLAMVLEHHIQIEAAFAEAASATSAPARRSAKKWLATLLTGHTTAEEAVIYPAMANTGQQGQATALYAEQSAVKIQMAALDDLAPMSKAYLDKLEHIRIAVARHIGEEEGDCFLTLKDTADPATNGRLTHLYREQFERSMGQGVSKLPA